MRLLHVDGHAAQKAVQPAGKGELFPILQDLDGHPVANVGQQATHLANVLGLLFRQIPEMHTGSILFKYDIFTG